MVELNQLVTPSEAAKLKDMTLNLFLYYTRLNRGPKPVLVGMFGHTFYHVNDVREWSPDKQRPKP